MKFIINRVTGPQIDVITEVISHKTYNICFNFDYGHERRKGCPFQFTMKLSISCKQLIPSTFISCYSFFIGIHSLPLMLRRWRKRGKADIKKKY